MSTPPVPVDAAARERARRDHGTSLVIEAGAGTGKTTLLIDRIEALLRAGTVRLDQIAAVTFTENAATTMKLRLRERLEKARLDPAARRRGAASARRRRWRPSSARRSRPSTRCARPSSASGRWSAAWCPGFRTADEAESELLFAQAWDGWLTDALARRPRRGAWPRSTKASRSKPRATASAARCAASRARSSSSATCGRWWPTVPSTPRPGGAS